LRLACIGTANRAWDNIQEVRDEQIVALCDVDSAYLEHVGKEFPDAARAIEWQQIVEYRRELDLDGIVIATPDHAHFPMAAAALRAGIPVYCEKPLNTRANRHMSYACWRVPRVFRRRWARRSTPRTTIDAWWNPSVRV
jgi:predicted dehydrogenase